MMVASMETASDLVSSVQDNKKDDRKRGYIVDAVCIRMNLKRVWSTGRFLLDHWTTVLGSTVYNLC